MFEKLWRTGTLCSFVRVDWEEEGGGGSIMWKGRFQKDMRFVEREVVLV